MDLTHGVVSPAGTDRRVPSWAAGLVAGLARDLPPVVTIEEIGARLAEAGSDRDGDSAVRELRRLGWLVRMPILGTWAFIPPGQDRLPDPYLPLRAWQARDPQAEFLLAGSAAAWHLGYLDRRPEGRTSIWLPPGVRLPDGLRAYISVVRISWQVGTAQVRPATALLARRRLDILNWADGLSACGPEALLVQLAIRPASFGPWPDLITHLGEFGADCDEERLVALLDGQSASAWQRAAYLLHAGGRPRAGASLLDRREDGPRPKIVFSHPGIRTTAAPVSVWVPEYRLLDSLIEPLQRVIGKA